jgi:hypothetical protein
VATSKKARAVGESADIPFTQRYYAVQHGGIVRAANSAITCRSGAQCTDARAGKETAQKTANGDFDMSYIDVDRDANTYNSSRAQLRLPAGARVSYARLYWGGNLRVGEQKPPKDNGRVLIAEPGGTYKEVLADTVVGHRVAHGADAYQASTDVTPLVRASGAGEWTVAQLNVARGHSAAGAWGGWSLVVAYEKVSQPLRRLAIWDGFGDGATRSVGLQNAAVPAGASGTAGLIAYNGDRSADGGSLSVSTGRGGWSRLSDVSNPGGGVLNSTIGSPGRALARMPSYPNTLGYDSDVFDLKNVLEKGGDRLDLRLAPGRDDIWAGVLFVAARTSARGADGTGAGARDDAGGTAESRAAEDARPARQ